MSDDFDNPNTQNAEPATPKESEEPTTPVDQNENALSSVARAEFSSDASDGLLSVSPASARRKKIVTAVIVLLLVVILAVVSALLVKHYVISTFVVQGTSMWPTLDGGSGEFDDAYPTNGEILYLNKLAKIKRGDIVVCTPDWEFLKDRDGNRRSIVKRVIGVAGDEVKIVNNKLYINGDLVNEPYINGEMDTEDGVWQVGEGQIFCMGDNRNHSTDSRVEGLIPLDCVVGKCFLIKGLDGKLRKP